MEKVKKQELESLFVGYEQAVVLKELGFDEPCFAWYVSKDFGLEIGKVIQTDLIKDAIVAPTYSAAFRFFREKYNRLHTVNIDLSNNLKDKVFVYTIEDHLGSIVDRSEEYKTYEEAEHACLNKLIEMIKNK